MARLAPLDRPGPAWLVATALVVVLAAGIAGWLLRTQQALDRRSFETQAAGVREEVEESYLRVYGVLQGARALYAASDEVSLQEFIAYFRALDDSTLGATAALIYDEGATRRPAYLVQRGSHLRQEVILDSEAVRRARETGFPVLGAPIILEHAERGPEPAYVLYLPLPQEADRGRGVVAGVFFARDLLEEAVKEHGVGDFLAVSLVDEESGETVAAMGAPSGDLVAGLPVQAPRRSWEVVVRPASGFPTAAGRAPGLIIVLGLVVAALMLRAGTLERSRNRLRIVEERLALAEELARSKDDFLAAVSHELRTPLASIHGFASLLNDGEIPPEEEREVLGIVLEQSRELANLVEDLLVDARASAGILTVAPESCEVRHEVETVLRALSLESVEVGVPAGLTASADPVRLRQILRNILRNAALYGGERIAVRAEADDGRTVIRLEDDGAGIPEQEAEGLFERYARGSAAGGSGMGIGLHLSRALAQLMDGELRHERRDGWTSFVLVLPEGDPNPLAGEGVPPKEDDPGAEVLSA